MPMWLVQTDSLPFLTISKAHGPLEWDVGLFYKARMQAASLHLANNAIVASKRGATRDLLQPSYGWKSVTCAPARTALCRHDETLDFFDTNHSTFPYAHTPELSRTYMPPVCSSSSFGRLQTSSTRTYTVSVCDLVHGHVHFVLLRAKGETRMLFKQDETALWQVMLLAATAIYAVTMLSVHVCELVHPDEPAVTSQRSKYAKLAAHAGFTVALVTMCATHHSFLVTDEDVLLASWLYVFVCADLLFTALRITTGQKFNDDSSHQVNGMIAILILVSLRLSSSFQNVFVVLLTIIFGVRTCSKLVQTSFENMTRTWTVDAVTRNFSVSFDVVVFYLLLSIAVPEQCDNEFEAHLLLSTVIFSAFNIGLLIAAAVQLRNHQNW
jgi:hypothetical protein